MKPVEPGVVIAVTGGIGCGKSEVERILRQHGFACCDADVLSRRALAAGTPAYRALVDRHGPSIVAPDGGIDRRRVAGIVFRQKEEREFLNALVHPVVLEEIRAWRADSRAKQIRAAAIVPLLFEAGAGDGWDAVVCVRARTETVMKRLLQRGLDRVEAQARMDAQMDLAEKAARSDYVITNDGSLDDLQRETGNVLNRILMKKGMG